MLLFSASGTGNVSRGCESLTGCEIFSIGSLEPDTLNRSSKRPDAYPTQNSIIQYVKECEPVLFELRLNFNVQYFIRQI
jgi:hypothetical protein